MRSGGNIFNRCLIINWPVLLQFKWWWQTRAALQIEKWGGYKYSAAKQGEKFIVRLFLQTPTFPRKILDLCKSHK